MSALINKRTFIVWLPSPSTPRRFIFDRSWSLARFVFLLLGSAEQFRGALD